MESELGRAVSTLKLVATVFGLLCLGVILTGIRRDMPLDQLVPKYTNPDSQFIDVDGINVHYRDTGRGPPILLLHGTSSSLHTWDHWAQNLAKDFRVVRLDIPPFGLTGKDPLARYSFAEYSRFLKEFTSKIGLRKFVIVGNSFGGRLAWNYAVDHPDQLKKLVLIDSAGYPIESGSLVAYKIASIPLLKSLLRFCSPRWAVYLSLRKSYGNPQLLTSETVTRYHELMLREGNRDAFLEAWRHRKDYRVARINKVAIPTLIMWGKKDRLISVEHAHRFADDISDAQLIIYEELGHMPMEEGPERTLRDLRKFLDP